jgi:KUP system potassium uptake protein
MPFWQDRLFIVLAQNAGNATDYFSLPTGRVVELGLQTVI